MRVRPIHESQEDRDSELEVAALLEEVWPGVKLEKLHYSYRLDFAIYSEYDRDNPAKWPENLTGFVEVKDRSKRYTWETFSLQGAYRLSLHKWMAAAQLCGVLELPWFLAVRCRDGLFVARIRPDRMETPRIVHAGRADRKVRDARTGRMIPDPADQEPMVEIPCDLFVRVD
jgi:hypothetical protein